MEAQQSSSGTGASHGSSIRRRVLLLGAAATLGAIGVGGVSVWQGDQQILREQDGRIKQLEQELRLSQATTETRITDELAVTLGIDRARVTRDAEILSDLAQTAMTWDSGETYEASRQELIDTYGMSEDGQLLSTFMPPSRFNEDAEGQRFYYIDTIGANSRARSDVRVEVVSVAADKYRYTASVTVDITSDAVATNDAGPGDVSTQRQMMLLATVDATGRVSDLEGFAGGAASQRSS